ncbi:hypothetical protein N7931_07975 [Catenovulum sp. 2E275]|uniref:hypothetical protein n=1 Tax=Catenovulum sp. 2E275 TaxID=2980497 RepID=UPI0021CE4BA7|nr:hypothetical protein [Catenovulum sp. 2E275]MCU4675573.1 hypothetical protein [Catenovulum sp. 2E275]
MKFIIADNILAEPVKNITALYNQFSGETHLVSPPLSLLLNKKLTQQDAALVLIELDCFEQQQDQPKVEQQLAFAIELGMISQV